MDYKNYLKQIKGFTHNTIRIYTKWANELEKQNRDYGKLLESLDDYSMSTMRLIISSIISYYKFLNDDRFKELSLPKKDIKVQEHISYEQYKKILSGINHKTKKGEMKRVIVRILFETGIRSSELLKLKINNINENTLLINGKGKKQRIVKISEWLLEELLEYASKQRDLLFPFSYKNLHSKISLLDKSKKITPHMFRRGYAKYCYLKGVPILDISISMGHSSVETTASYIKRKSDDINIYRLF